MDENIRRLLKEFYDQMMSTITDPNIFASDIHVLTPIDLERIRSETRERGDTTGVFELLNRLQKRGPNAFQELLDALKKNGYYDIADKMEQKAISRGLYRPVASRPPSPKPSHPVQPSSLNHKESIDQEMHVSGSAPVLYTQIDIPRPEELTPYKESKAQKTRKGKESFLKDIPSNLKNKIVNMLNNEDALGNDWKGVAGELQLTAEQQGQVKSCSKTTPMDELFNHMIHLGYQVSNLIHILKKIQRQDVIAEITTAGFQDQEEDEELQSPTQLACDSANKCNKDLPLPRQASDDCTEEEKKTATGPTACSLLPTKSRVEENGRKAFDPTVSILSPTNSTVKENKREARSPVIPTRNDPYSGNPTVMKEMEEEKEDAILSTTGHPSPTEVSALGSDDTKKKKGSSTTGLPSPTEVSAFGSDDTKKKKGSSTAGRPSETEDGELEFDKEEAGPTSLPSPTQAFGSDDTKKKKGSSTTGLPSPTEVSAFGSDDTKKKKGSSTTGHPSPTEVSAFGSDDTKKKKGSSTTGLPSPTEVSAFGSDDTKKKKGSYTTGHPSPTEVSAFGSDDTKKKKGSSTAGPTSLPSPTQVSVLNSLDGSKSGKKKEARLSQEIEDAKMEEQDERNPLTDMTSFEEVFFPDAIRGKVIFITCEKYDKMTKLTNLNRRVKTLSREMEDNGNWEAIDTFKDYTSAKLKSELSLKLHNLHQRSDVCFVYLAGHTLQINGENYFLPKDVELNLAAADIMDSCLNINKLVKDLSDKALMALIIVDGGHQYEEEFECPFARPGFTSIIPLSNTVIAFPCQPGYIRPPQESLLYLEALTSVIKEKEHLALTDLFDSVREELKDSRSLPVESSLSPSLLPIYLNTSEEDDEGIAIRKPDDTTPRRAIVFCDESFDKETVLINAGHLEASLKQLGWKVERYSNLKPEQIKKIIRQSLKGMPKMNVFMLYFIGYVPKDKESIGQNSWEVDVYTQKLPIQWLVNIMSQFITGPKVLIVDHPSMPLLCTLSPMTALPQEVLVCLPKENRESRREEKNSFTLLFAQNLAAIKHSSLKNVIFTTARHWKYDVNSNLFYS